MISSRCTSVLPIVLLGHFETTTLPIVPFTSDKTGATESTITGTTGYYSEKSNSVKWFLLLYTKQSGFPVAHHPVLINYPFLLHYATD